MQSSTNDISLSILYSLCEKNDSKKYEGISLKKSQKTEDLGFADTFIASLKGNIE